MLSVCCLSVSPVLSCLSVCDVRALWPNSSTDQDETRHAGRPRPWPHCVRLGPSSPSPKGTQPPIFGPYLLRSNGCSLHGSRCHLIGMELGLSPGDFVSDGDQVPFPQKGAEPPPQFSTHFYCGQMAGWMKTPLCTEVDIGAGHIVLDGFPALRERGTAPPSFRPMSIVATVAHLSYC